MTNRKETDPGTDASDSYQFCLFFQSGGKFHLGGDFKVALMACALGESKQIAFPQNMRAICFVDLQKLLENVSS